MELTDDCKTVTDQLPVIFLLRNLLEIPLEVCFQFLQDYGNPRRWIHYCDSCSDLVDKARNVCGQMKLLQKQYKRMQTELKDAILISINSPESDYCDDLDEGSEIVRLYINNLRYQNLGNSTAPVSLNDECTESSVNAVSDALNSQNFHSNCQGDSSTVRVNRRKQNLKNLAGDKEEKEPEKNPIAQKYSSLESRKEFLNADDLIEHDQAHKDEKPIISCNFCLKRFSTDVALALHLKMHSRQTQFKCEHCSAYFLKSGILKTHLKRSHPKERRVASRQCKFCKKRFGTAKRLELHARIHNVGYIPFTCKICNNDFASILSLNMHTTRMHRKGQIKIKPHKRKSNQSFKTAVNLKIHDSVIFTGVNSYKCKICSKGFTAVRSLNRHTAQIHPLTRFVCKICNKAFTSKQRLISHERQIHNKIHGVRQNNCQLCGMRFRSSDTFKIHMKSHAAEKEGSMKDDTEEKSYTCKICGDRFTTSDRLKKHNKTYHGLNKSHKCEVCFKGFEDSDALIRHHKVHGLWPSKCELCGMRFRDPDTLKSHMKTHS